MSARRGTPPTFSPPTIATRVPARTPEWKTHRTMGHARAALSTRRYWSSTDYGEVWTHTGAEWVLAEVQEGIRS